ncbi:MAG: diaminopimelate epimerase, partial [Proteobacteria bacterium]|nr:diaminopimelate epimerase [Pseudomonadota bacterium]
DWLPNRANVSFVEVRGLEGLYVRTHERGVGLTDSCGSAMAASLFAACLTERADFDSEVTVYNRGGLVRGCAAPDGMVRLSGNATWEWEGSAEIDPERALAGDVVVERHFNEEIAAWAAALEAT